MKIYIYGAFNFKKDYLLPTFSALDICEEEKVLHRWYQAAWIGKTINIEKVVKNNKKTEAWFFTVYNFIIAFNSLLI